MKKIKLDHVERLSRGKSSGIRVGSRAVGHHLQPFEREHYQRALKKGYLEITEKDRANLWHIWHKACQAQQVPFLVLMKRPSKGDACIYKNDQLIGQYPLKQAKQHIQYLTDCKRTV